MIQRKEAEKGVKNRYTNSGGPKKDTSQFHEYYFLQMCGYSNGNIRSDLMETHHTDSLKEAQNAYQLQQTVENVD